MRISQIKYNTTLRHYLLTLRSLYTRFFCHNKFRNKGTNNSIKISRYVSFYNCKITIQGADNTVIFEEGCTLRGLNILVSGVGNLIFFGKNVVVNASSVQPTVINCVGGGKITIGHGSLLSNSIEIHNTDYHGIYNFKGQRINPEKDITIGNSVWVGFGSKILKGTEISDYNIVGCGSLVSGCFLDKYVIIAGNPAKIIKTDVFWNHRLANTCQVPNN